MPFRLDPQSLRKLHTNYYGSPPTERQAALYDGYPDLRGVSYGARRDKELFLCVLHLALTQTIPENPASEPPQPTYLLYPPTLDSWVLEQTTAIAEMVFDRLRQEGNKAAAVFVGGCFKALKLGCVVHRMQDAPERWAAYGFSEEDSVPEWFSKAVQTKSAAWIDVT